MAIVIRRGAYADFVPSKLQPGEFADVQSGDPNTTDGKALYICLASGNVVRIASSSEIDAIMTDVDLHLATWAGNLAPEYSSSSGYSVGDFAVHENVLYKCRTNIPAGGEAWNPNHWIQTTLDDVINGLKILVDNAKPVLNASGIIVWT